MRLHLAIAAGITTTFGHLHQAFADSCASRADAATASGAAGGPVSSAIELVAPMLLVGVVAFAVKRLRK
jgi:hypothetical protein